MIPALFYGIGCFVVAVIFTVIYAMFRSIESRDEWKSWRTMIFFYCLALVAPYGWCEIMTLKYGKNMKPVIQDVMDEVGVNGDLNYYKVLYCKDGKARVIAVAVEKASWGGTDRPLVAMTLIQKGDKWDLDTYRVVRSDERNEDSFTFPPYF
jgi:hypothetical protein